MCANTIWGETETDTETGRNRTAAATKKRPRRRPNWWTVRCESATRNTNFTAKVFTIRHYNECIRLLCATTLFASEVQVTWLLLLLLALATDLAEEKACRFHFVRCVLSSLLFNHIVFSAPSVRSPLLGIFIANIRAVT